MRGPINNTKLVTFILRCRRPIQQDWNATYMMPPLFHPVPACRPRAPIYASNLANIAAGKPIEEPPIRRGKTSGPRPGHEENHITPMHASAAPNSAKRVVWPHLCWPAGHLFRPVHHLPVHESTRKREQRSKQNIFSGECDHVLQAGSICVNTQQARIQK